VKREGERERVHEKDKREKREIERNG